MYKRILKLAGITLSIALNVALAGSIVASYSESQYWKGIRDLNLFAKCYQGRIPFPDDLEKLYQAKNLIDCKDIAEIVDNSSYPDITGFNEIVE
jgi:hypothetical protein